MKDEIEATFNKLKRTDYAKLDDIFRQLPHEEWYRLILNNGKYEEFLNKHGWTLSELTEYERLAYGKINTGRI